MQFKAQVAFKDSAETIKRHKEAEEAKDLLFKAIQLISHQLISHDDEQILAEVEEYLKGQKV